MFKLPRTNLHSVDNYRLDTYCYQPPLSSININKYPPWTHENQWNLNLSPYIRVSGSKPGCVTKYDFFIVYIICLKILIYAGAGVLSVSSYPSLYNYCYISKFAVFPLCCHSSIPVSLEYEAFSFRLNHTPIL